MEGITVAGKYRIIEKLGEGGMGVVYKAEDMRLDRMVALKFLPPELMKDSDAKERFIREAKAAASLSHPNICTIHEIDEDQGKSFIAMEYIEGQSIRERIKKSPLDIPEALDVAIQAAQGLEEAHKKGIIHRDIKSANIMVTESGQAKVMDFGLAKVSGASLLTREASTMGTVAYMSPEQAQGQSVDQRTDIWSLGVVLYEMLTGQFPFLGDTDQSVMYAIARKTPVPMKKVVPKVTPELERVVEKALEKKPSDRYQNMGELLEDLRAIAEGMQPIRAKSRLFRGRIFGVRKPVFLATSAAIILILAALGLLVLLSSPGHTDVFNSVAILPIINETGNAEREYFANGLTRELNTELYKVGALTVPPAETILTYKNSNKPPKKIAEELGVKAVVQVSWLQVGNRHRLNYELSDPFRNKIIAADRLEMEEEDIIILQRELARAVVDAIKVAVTPSEQALLAGGRKVNPEAYNLLMRGIEYVLPADADVGDRQKSLECLQNALDLDPDLALAHAWLGFLYLNMGINSIEDYRVVYPKAWKAVEKALEIDKNLAIAYAVRGRLKFEMNWDFAGADQDFEKALELAPGDMVNPLIYETFLCVSGRADKAIALIKKRTEERKPVGLEGRYVERLTLYYLLAGRYDEALEELAKIPMVGPNLLANYSAAKALKGSYAEALEVQDEIRNQLGGKDISYFRKDRAWILALAGRREEALEALEEHVSIQAKKNIETEFDEACIYAALGDKDKAFELLFKAYENHSSHILLVLADWSLNSLHEDKRFQDLVKKVGFPDNPSQKNR